MAFVHEKYVVTYNMKDKYGKRWGKSYNLDSIDLATAVSDEATIRAALLAVTGLSIESFNITDRYINDAFALPTNADGSQQALVVASLEDPAKEVQMYIPAPAVAVMQGTSGTAATIVDVTSTELNEYLDLFQTTGPCTISDGEKLENIANPASVGRLISRKVRYD